LYDNSRPNAGACAGIAGYLFYQNRAMAKSISGHSAYKSAVAIPVAPPLRSVVDNLLCLKSVFGKMHFCISQTNF
jgi:hypothetical protein